MRSGIDIPLWLVLPFALLLALIAIMPLTPPRAKHAWERGYPFGCVVLGGLVAAFYCLKIPGAGGVIAHTLHEYFSFIALLASLYVVAGGIHLTVKGEATPLVNVGYLALGAIAANVIGTTGASMVLIRPWIRMNKIRIGPFHVVFFIFIVSNLGGALTPIGDPPLFLGYLRGVPVFWLVERVLPAWLCTLGAVLAVFFVYDWRSFRRMPQPLQRTVETAHETWRFEGLVNVLFLFAIVAAVFLPPAYLLREGVMLAAAVASWFLTPRSVHEENAFTFAPIKEVAWLFLGLFTTMMPALGYLSQHGAEFGLAAPRSYYFASGALSAVLDNAPTYLNFFELARATSASTGVASGLFPPGSTPALLATDPLLIVAISLGSVFFGAMTYIGNGPNFMVRAIAHDAGVHCPTFFGYVLRYSVPILLPILVLVGIIFL